MKRIYLQRAKTQIARPNTIRDINKQIVLNYVRDRSPISRAEIARETTLQRSTVSAIIDDLRSVGLIEEIGVGASSGVENRLFSDSKPGKRAVGIDITPRETTIAVADLAGAIMEQEVFATSPNIEYMSKQIIERVSALAKKYSHRKLKAGMSLPGIVDHSLGKALYIPYFGWRDWDIAEQIQRESGVPVTMDNDANSIALAELWFGDEKIRRINNFITVLVAEGIGTGVVFDGQVYRGEQGAAGEFGHMVVGANAPVQCSCGSRDCWEALASEKATVARYKKLAPANGFQNADIKFAQLIKLAREGDRDAVGALTETAKYLGIGISNLIVGLSPQAVVVGGSISEVWDLIADDVNFAVERSVRSNLPKPVIAASTLGDHPTLIGSITLVLVEKFASAS